MAAAFEATARALFSEQKQRFLSGATRGLAARLAQLKALRQSVLAHQEALFSAYAADLGRSRQEVEQAEIGPLLNEIDHAASHLAEWMQQENVPTPPELGDTACSFSRAALGVVLIIGPFNYPLYLTGCPLIGAICGGNTAIVKPSEATPAIAQVLEQVINTAFASAAVHVLQGARAENEILLALPFDLIFFTGSPATGRAVMAAAAKNLTPVVLELGGKCPAIVLHDACLENVVSELLSSKLINSGQTCVAPDWLYVDARIKAALLERLTAALAAGWQQAGHNGKTVSVAAWDRLDNMLQASRGRVVFQGDGDRQQRGFGPAVIDDVGFDDSTMQEEIFGPLFPLLTFSREEEIAHNVNRYHPTPLAVYLFSEDIRRARALAEAIPAGGVGINALMQHAASPYLPFGGVGLSGIGSYHGHASYLAFTHARSLRIRDVSRPARPGRPQ